LITNVQLIPVVLFCLFAAIWVRLRRGPAATGAGEPQTAPVLTIAIASRA
jgi:hypothetical protein